MSGHQHPAHGQVALGGGAAVGVDPGAGGTFDLYGKTGVVFTCAGAADTRIAPPEEGIAVGTVFFVINNGSSGLDVNNDASSTIVTLASEEAAIIFMSQGTSERKWLATVLTHGATA